MGSITEVQRLLANGASVNRENYFHECPLHLASGRGHAECARVLLCAGALADVRNGKRQTPLLLACLRPSVETVRVLLQHGADPDALADSGTTPRAEARLHGDPVLIALLDHADDVVPVPGIEGSFVLRRLEGLAADRLKAEQDRRRRIEAQATGSHYPSDAPSQVAAMDIAGVRRGRLMRDIARLQQPLWLWTADDVCLWMLRLLELNPSDPSGALLLRSSEKPPSEGQLSTTPRAAEGSSAAESQDLRRPVAPTGTGPAGRSERPLVEEGHRRVGQEEGTGASVGDRHSRAQYQRPGTRPRPAPSDWSTVEPVPDLPRSSAFVPWLAWFEAAGVRGRHMCYLCRHERPLAALAWLLGCAGLGPKDRGAVSLQVLARAKEDGSLQAAATQGCLPVAVATDVLSAAATLVFVGEVPVGKADALSHVRGRLVGGAGPGPEEQHDAPLGSASAHVHGNNSHRGHAGREVQDRDRGAGSASQSKPAPVPTVAGYATDVLSLLPLPGPSRTGAGKAAATRSADSGARTGSRDRVDADSDGATHAGHPVVGAGELAVHLPAPMEPGFAILSCTSSRPVDGALEKATTAMSACFGVLVLAASSVEETRLPQRPGTEPNPGRRTRGAEALSGKLG